MNASVFCRLPRLTILVVLIVIAAASGALSTLVRQEDPTLVERYGLIITPYPGADAEQVEALVVEPLERALLELREVDELEVTARAGVAQISLALREDLSEQEVEEGWTLVREKVGLAEAEFPAGVGATSIERQFLGATTRLVGLVWTGDGPVPDGVMARLARDLRERFQNVPGTEKAEIFGAALEEIRVEIDAEALSAAGLTLPQAAARVAAADAKTPAGRLRGAESNLGVEVGGEFDGVARVRSVPLAQTADGRVIRLGDIAGVSRAVRDPPESLARVDGETAVLVGAYLEPGVRLDVWAARADEMLAAFREKVPAGVEARLLFDQAVYTGDRLNGLIRNLGYSGLIVFAVLFFVMGWRAAVAVGLALPLTLCLVLILFRLFDMPLHQMSVTGLVIALGLLIDNAVVATDTYGQRRRAGADKATAIDEMSGRLLWPLFASTLTTALAFAPIALLPGSAGEFVGMMGVAVMFAVSSSLLVAMTVTPAFAAWFGVGEVRGGHRWMRDGLDLPALADGYRAALGFVLRRPALGVLLGLAPAIGGLVAMASLPEQFFPPTERDNFQVEITLSPDASIDEAVRVVEAAEARLLAEPGVTGVVWTIGETAPRVYYNAFNNVTGLAGYAAGFVQTESPKATRAILDTGRLQQDLRAAFPEAQFLTLPYQQGPPTPAPIELTLIGPDISVLAQLGDQVRAALAATPSVTYSLASVKTGGPTLKLQADETALGLTGRTLAGLAGDLRAELDGIEAGSVLEGVERVPVRLMAAEGRRSDVAGLSSLPLPGGGSVGAPLSALGPVTLDPEISVLTRLNGERSNQILAWLEPYVLTAYGMERFQAELEASGFDLPSGYRLVVGGEAAESGDANSQLAATALPLIIAMAGCVALVFNSFRIAGLVMLVGVLSIFMAFIGVWGFGLTRGFMAIIGAMGLLGVAINGAIIVLSGVRENPEAAAGDPDALRDVVMEASRHILATTLTTIGGFLPLILSGDSFWLPLATGIAGGVGGSALLALFFVPSVYRLIRPRRPRGEPLPAAGVAAAE